MNFYALVLNSNDSVAQLKVLRAMTVRGAKVETKKLYLESEGLAVIFDGNPLNPRHLAKEVGAVARG